MERNKMATVLLIVIYIDFIGLGIPDPLFGAAWPAIYPELSLALSSASAVSLLVSGLTMLSSLMSARLINRFGYGKVTALSTGLTALALIGYSHAGSLWFFCLCAVPLGLGAGAIDSGLNNYVALHYHAAHMNFLHCAYSVGTLLSPYLISAALGGGESWRTGYRWAFFVQLGITVLAVLSIPFYRGERKKRETADFVPVTLSFRQMLKMPKVRTVWWIFIGSCAIEITCANWASTYLVNSRGLTAAAAAGTVTIYFIGMLLGRFLAGVFSSRLSSWQLIHIGQGIMLFAIVVLFLPFSLTISVAALFLIGFGCAPIFPNLNQLTPQNFGREISQSVMGTEVAAGYFGIMVMPALFGVLAQKFSTDILPGFLLVMYALMLLATFRMKALLRAEHKS